jgi:hypothetical protein
LANWKHKTRSHTLGPIQTVSTIVEKFHVPLGYVCRCVSAPKMLESLWAIRFLKVSDAEAPEDVKATIPSWPGVIHSNKGRIHLRRPTCDILTFRLRRSGGPYIPDGPSLGHNRRGEPVDHILGIANCTSTCTRSSFASPVAYFSFAYSALARWKIGMLGSASFHSVRKSW